MSKLIAISIGDINGIGIELLLTVRKNKKFNNFVLFTNIDIFNKYLKKKRIKIKINVVNEKNDKIINFKKNYFNIFTFKSKSINFNTYESIKYCYEFTKIKKFKGIITLPLRKDLIKKNISKTFVGHTEFFQKLDNKQSSNMILHHDMINVSPLTTHINLKSISRIISKKNYLFKKIIDINKIFRKDFNIKKPKFIISGINPHAGENGEIGEEEIKIIKPLIKKLNKINIQIDGPFSADSMLLMKNIKSYDCFLFIYHDQALIRFKYISKFSGVNFTGNLDIIRTSPDHGTAYDLVGKKKVSKKSLENCFKLINQISKNRQKYEER